MASQRVLELHHKFRVPGSAVVPFWQPTRNFLGTAKWPDNPCSDTRTDEEWKQFCSIPFNEDSGYEMYVEELAKISASYKHLMARKNCKGTTALKIMQNGASRLHYECLQNSTRLVTRLGAKATMLGAGTTRNEQLHRELKSWGRNIMMAHVDRIHNGISLFVMAKLLTHSSASYSPTLTQASQRRLLCRLAGQIRVMNFFPTPSETIDLSDTRRSGILRKPRVRQSTEASAMRREKRKTENNQWKKRNHVIRSKRLNETNIFKRRRADTRVRANKN